MIDATNLKSPGWQNVVGELSAAVPDDKTFLNRLLRVVARVSAARQAVLFVPPPEGAATAEMRAISIWPAGDLELGAAADTVIAPTEQTVIEYASDARSAAWAAIESSQSRVFNLDATASNLYGDKPSKGYVLALPLPSAEGRPGAAITLLIEARTKPALQSTLAMSEVLVGYVHAHAARQQLRRTESASAALELASRLLSAINGASNFKGAALQLVNDLARHFHADRVALGWVEGDAVHVKSLSDTEQFSRRMAMVQRIETAMDECYDQEQPILFPAPAQSDDVLLAQAIVHAHRELAAGQPNLSICSLPLRDGDNVMGVITLESTAGPVNPAGVELIQSVLDLVSPVLRVRRSDDRVLPLRIRDDLLMAGRWLVGPKHTAWKLAGATALIALIFVSVYTTTYHIGAQSILQPRVKQIISVPFDGLIRFVPANIEAGARVKKGDVLAEMDTSELILSAEDARQKISQAETQMAAARAEGKTSEALKALAQGERARAELATAEWRIGQSRLVAPFDGTILTGRLTDRIGSSAKVGERLYELAPLNEMVAVTRVDERDIALISEGGKGRIATRSHPSEASDLVIESIVPLAEADEGKNLFEVRAKVEEPAAWMRPGMEGYARLDAGRHSLLYIGTRRVIDTIRLWLW